jgi:hypothetical protein
MEELDSEVEKYVDSELSINPKLLSGKKLRCGKKVKRFEKSKFINTFIICTFC